jgi:hypothetical protein
MFLLTARGTEFKYCVVRMMEHLKWRRLFTMVRRVLRMCASFSWAAQSSMNSKVRSLVPVRWLIAEEVDWII